MNWVCKFHHHKGSQEWLGIFSMFVCWVNFYVSVVDVHIMKEHPNYWELKKTAIVR